MEVAAILLVVGLVRLTAFLTKPNKKTKPRGNVSSGGWADTE